MLLKLFDCVDDTTLLSKAIVTVLTANLDALISDKYGRLTLLFLLSPRSQKYFPPSVLDLIRKISLADEKGELKVSTIEKFSI